MLELYIDFNAALDAVFSGYGLLWTWLFDASAYNICQ